MFRIRASYGRYVQWSQPASEEEWEPLVTCRAMDHLPNLHNLLQLDKFWVSKWQTFFPQELYSMTKTEYRLVNMTALLTFSYCPPKVRSLPCTPTEIPISTAASRVTCYMPFLHPLAMLELCYRSFRSLQSGFFLYSLFPSLVSTLFFFFTLGTTKHLVFT